MGTTFGGLFDMTGMCLYVIFDTKGYVFLFF